jgi:LmbE family N-acetylglucosaminyl deacetylase
MSTVVFFHAHPDDEAIFTGGTIALLADAGVRVTVVIATSGEQGLHHGGGHAARRAPCDETRLACAALGVDHVEFLGYEDSGLAAPGRADAGRGVRARRCRRGGAAARGDPA